MMKHTKWTTSYLRKWNKETFEVLAGKQTGVQVVWCKWIDGFNENERRKFPPGVYYASWAVGSKVNF